MGNRSLIEINHDYADMIAKHPGQFLEAVLEHLRGGGTDARELFQGVRMLGMRHHTDGYTIKWGAARHHGERSRP